jgi:hypothetical protein
LSPLPLQQTLTGVNVRDLDAVMTMTSSWS